LSEEDIDRKTAADNNEEEHMSEKYRELRKSSAKV